MSVFEFEIPNTTIDQPDLPTADLPDQPEPLPDQQSDQPEPKTYEPITLASAPASIAQSAPSLASACVLVELSIPVWGGNKLDRRASEKVTTESNAAKGVARVNKSLLGDCPELDALKKYVANVRNAHYAMTTPWGYSGLAVMTTEQLHSRYLKAMSEYKAEFWRMVQAFLSSYEWEVQQAQLKLGDLFNPDDYPTVDALRSKFDFRLNYMPLVPANAGSGAWMLGIEDEAREHLEQSYKKFYESQMTRAMGSIWERVYDAVAKMCDKLNYKDTDADKPRLFESLVTNVIDLVGLMESCNITKDPAMTDAARRLRMALEGVTKDALKDDEYLRHDVRNKVSGVKDDIKRIIDNLPGLGF